MEFVTARGFRERSRLTSTILALVLGAGSIGCAMEGARDERKGAPVQPGNSTTLGVDYSSLPKGKMYQPVPGTDVP